jgi:plasmid stabilization system protein ParE
VSTPVILRRAAQQEFARAADWYEDQRSGLGAAFTRAVGGIVATISSHPDRYAVVHSDVREALVPGYPFAIYYRVEPARVVVVAVFHASRDPEERHGRT